MKMCAAQLSASSLPVSAEAANGTKRRYLKFPMSSHGNLYNIPGLVAIVEKVETVERCNVWFNVSTFFLRWNCAMTEKFYDSDCHWRSSD
jgi:hypothetical protein